MPKRQYIIALDQGTTSSRAIIFDPQQNIVGMAQKEFAQHYPKPGWVEHDAMELFSSQYSVLTEVLAKSGVTPQEVAAVGITNQRETTVVWDKETGRPIYNAIVWQCRRTAPLCDELAARGLSPYIKQTTGLMPDAYFSATKLAWLLDNVPGARERAKRGGLLFGTVDSWLLWKLTGGRVHATDRTNASRTMMFNIHTLQWDAAILDALGIPACMLPEVRPSSGPYGFVNLQGCDVPIVGIAGDQQAALFGQTCFDCGSIKNTYGTGCFMLMNTGDRPCESHHGMLTTLAASEGDSVRYALEGSVFTGGAVIQWLRDELRLLDDASDSEYFATRVPDNGGVFIVPAFTGLGAPHWDMYARGAILGLTRGTGRNHLIRAALESIAYQTRDLMQAIEQDTGVDIKELRVDGGASANNFLMQFQADILGKAVRRPMIRETTALGAAYLAGLGIGLWRNTGEIRENWTLDRVYTPEMAPNEQTHLLNGWQRALQRAQNWEQPL